jgi:demethylmenaquinone methyltransferase/2-methoxy-6-polyprenyl-1,4-benzoquinol methylase
MSIVVRPAVPEEWEALKEVRLAALRESPDAFGSTYEREAQADEATWRGWTTGEGWDGAVATFVAEEERRLLGMATAYRPSDEPGTVWMFATWVRPDHRGRGIGRALVKAVVDQSRSLGAEVVMLRVTEGNTGATGLYASCGFIGTPDPPEPLRDGSALTTRAMWLPLGDPSDDELLRTQLTYYDDRAAVYEDLWFRRGAYDGGPEDNARWFEEAAVVEAMVADLDASGDVLDLAAGSGLWTRLLAPRAGRLVAVDASPQMLARNRARYGDPHVEYVRADVFSWDTHDQFDLIAMGFFISHVPPARFKELWARLRTWLRPGGCVWLVDERWRAGFPRAGARSLGGPSHAHRRRLGDRHYTIVKLFYTPEEIAAELDALGWDADIRGTGERFYAGTARPRRWLSPGC